MLIAELCINIAFLRCHMHFSHITVGKLTTTIKEVMAHSVVAATSLNIKSTCKLSVISAIQLQIQSM